MAEQIRLVDVALVDGPFEGKQYAVRVDGAGLPPTPLRIPCPSMGAALDFDPEPDLSTVGTYVAQYARQDYLAQAWRYRFQGVRRG